MSTPAQRWGTIMPPEVVERHVATSAQRWAELEATLRNMAGRLEAIEATLGELRDVIHVRAILG